MAESDDELALQIWKEVAVDDYDESKIRFGRRLRAAWQQGQEPESIERRNAEWEALNTAIQTYSNGYEYDGTGYTPSDQQMFICHDFLQGLISDDAFMAAIAKVYPVRSQFTPRAAENASIPDDVVMVPKEQIQRWSDAIWHNDVEQAGREMRIMLVERQNAAGKIEGKPESGLSEAGRIEQADAAVNSGRPTSPAAPDDALDARRYRWLRDKAEHQFRVNSVLPAETGGNPVDYEYEHQWFGKMAAEYLNATIDAAIAAQKGDK